MVQPELEVHATLSTVSTPGGATAAVQVAPPSTVVNTTPLPGTDAPFVPTAMHRVALGHETPLSCGMNDPDTACGFHCFPPSLVATITVAGLLGPVPRAGTPTAQQRDGVGQEMAARSLPAGAGCPTASGVPCGCPRTRGGGVAARCPFEQADVATATTARRIGRPPPNRLTRLCPGTVRGDTGRRH